jgi:hypothetical protein
MSNMSGPLPRPACPRDALPGAAAQARAFEALILALLRALFGTLARRRPHSHPATIIVPGQRHAPGRAPHALAFALRLVPDWIFTSRNRGMRAHARTAPATPRPAARDPP